MKKRIVMFLAAAMTVIGGWADEWTDPNTGYTWSYRINGGTAQIYKDDDSAAITPNPTGSVTIPSTLGGKPVTSIGGRAFSGCSGLTGVTIPDSVMSIRDYAFSGCSGLTGVTIPDSVISIGDYAFSGCSGLTGVTIPDGAARIGKAAFSGCSGLTSVTIPDSVTSIGRGAFSGCSGLMSVTIGKGLTSIWGSTFSGCSGLMKFEVGAENPVYKSENGLLLSKDGTVLILGVNGTVTIPDSVTRIGSSAFSECSGLTSVTIGNSVTNIAQNAFSYCSSLMSFTVDNGNANYSSSNGLLLSKDGKMLVHGVNGAVTIPDCVTSIGEGAFSGCSGLTSVTIGNSVTSIAQNAFSGCRGLTSVTIGNSVTSIGDHAFEYCSGLTSVTIGDSVTSIAQNAFSGCSGLMSFAVDNGNANYSSSNGLLISKDGKMLIHGVNGTVTIPDCVTSIGEGAFVAYSGLTSVTIPDSVTDIGDYAFSGCSGLTNVTIPDSVTSMGYETFYGCSGLTSMKIGNGLTSISDGAFYDCSGLTSVTIPDSVTRIGHEAFRGCVNLASVTIPASVTYIGDAAFAECDGLTGIHITDLAAWCRISFDDYPLSLAHRLYLNGSLLTDMTIPDGVTRIRDSVFSGCSCLTSVTIPDSVTSIGYGAFYGCSGLTSVTIGNGVTNIWNYAFSGCSGLKSFTVSADNPAYKSVDGLLLSKDGATLIQGVNGDVTIPDSVTNIRDYAFYDCSGLTSVTIPNSVTNIGWGAFIGCSGLTSVTIGNGVTSIGSDAFSSTALVVVHVEVGDTDRVKSLLTGSGYDVSGVTFIEAGSGSGGDPDPVTPDPDPTPQPTPEPTPDPVTPGYEVIEATDITAPYEAPKAVTLHGVAYDGGDVFGVVELKLGKVSKGKSKVSGSFTGLDGKKITIKAVNVTGIDGSAPVSVSLEVKGIGTMTVTIGGDRFAGSMGKYHVQSGTVGGNWTRAGAKVYVDAGGGRGATALPAGTIEELLPDGEPVAVSGGKWKFAKAAGVKWAKPKKGAALPERYDEASGKGLIVDDTKGKTNLSAMKLTYTPKKGTFKGSFKVYALEGAGKATKLKKYTVKVSGVVVGGVGYGTATCKNPAVSWSVTVK